MRRVLISDSPETVGALASWLNERLDVNEKQCSVLALALLERKELKIKRGALDRVLKSLHGAERIDEMREALVSGGLIVQLGRDEFGPYRIRLDAAGIDADAVLAALRTEQADGDAAEDAVPSSEQDAPAAEGARVVEENAACQGSDDDTPASNKNDGRTRERRERRHRSARKGSERHEGEPLAKRAPRAELELRRHVAAVAPEDAAARYLARLARRFEAAEPLRADRHKLMLRAERNDARVGLRAAVVTALRAEKAGADQYLHDDSLHRSKVWQHAQSIARPRRLGQRARGSDNRPHPPCADARRADAADAGRLPHAA